MQTEEGSMAAGAGNFARVLRRPRVLVGAAGGSAAVAAAVVALAGGGSAVGAAAALADAAGATAGFHSGVVTLRTVAGDSGAKVDATEVIKFSGADFDVTAHGTKTSGDDPATTSDLEVLQVAGKQWQRDLSDPDAQWAPSSDVLDVNIGSRVAGDGLVDLVKSASNVQQDGSTFTATVDGSKLADLPTTPFGLDGAAEGGPVGVRVTLASDGSVQKLDIDTAGVIRSTEFSEMGAPQSIDAP